MNAPGGRDVFINMIKDRIKEHVMNIRLEPAYEYREEIKELFTEYTRMLVDGDPAFQEYLDQQNYDEEVRNLKMKYDYPAGRLYIALAEDKTGNVKAAGCVGMKPLDEGRCELKRLYVRPEFRGVNLGELLVSKILEDSREAGYKTILLDTLPFLNGAKRLYERMGFQECEKYNDSPMDTSIFMKLDL
jgi:ribosomal protein S18 acetylase RimI-like enzyme